MAVIDPDAGHTNASAAFLFLEAISLFSLQIATARGHEHLGRDPQTGRHAAVIQIDDTA